MRIVGIILLVLQVVSLVPALASGDPIFTANIAWLIGRYSLGIVGVILLIISRKDK